MVLEPGQERRHVLCGVGFAANNYVSRTITYEELDF